MNTSPLPTRALLTLLFVGVLMGAVDIAIIGPALPAIQAEFGMNNRELAVLFNAYILCQIVGTQLLAKLADRMGLRRIYIFSIGLFALGSLLLVVASASWQLYLGRAVQGFGAGGLFPVATAVIAARLPVRERGPALGILGAVWGVAFLLGPILGGILLRFSWHWLFLINLPVAALLVLGALRLLPPDSGRAPKPFDLAGAATLATALTVLVLGVNNLDTSAMLASFTSAAVWPLFAAALVLVPLFWHIEQRAADPIMRPALFQSRQIVTACVVGAGVGAMQSAGVFYPLLLVEATGLPEADAALMLLPGVLVSTVAAPVAGRLINIVGTRVVILASLVVGVLAFQLIGRAEVTLPIFIAASMLSGLSMAGLLGAPLRFVVLTEASAADRASAQGLFSNTMSIGRLMGAATVGAVATSMGGGVVGYQSAFLGMSVLGMTLLLVGLALNSRSAEQRVIREREAAAARQWQAAQASQARNSR
ncbi:MAG: MFS transporter [Chromatiales bacterium]|nr:MFS transporter [Chromatiales bacterium]